MEKDTSQGGTHSAGSVVSSGSSDLVAHEKQPALAISEEKPQLDKDNFSINEGDQEVHELAAEMGQRLGAELGISEHDIDYMHNIIRSMTVDEAREILEKALKEHIHDRNFPKTSLDTIRGMLSGEKEGISDVEGVDREFAMKAEAALIHYHSPYPEVRSVTDPYDDPEMLVETLRVYVLGSIWVIVGVGVNQFFEPHQPPVNIPATLFQLLILPCGWFWAWCFPDWGFSFRGKRYSLNPGPWTYKEQILATIMFDIANAVPYVDSQIMVQKMPMFYDQDWANAGYQFLLTLSTQFLGFGIAGLMRSVLIYPAKQLWMGNFPTLALNRTLMAPETGAIANGWKIPRYWFFGICFVGMFIWEWFPQYLMQFLGYFNWMTWIKPDNFNLAMITGSIGGLGVNPISSFDWNTINYTQPLITPWFSMANMAIGAILGGCVLIPAVYWSNMYYTAYLPLNSSSLYTNTGDNYDVLQVLTNGVLDKEKYQEYSPPYYSAANLVVYGCFFANYTSIFVRSLLYEWRVMAQGFVEVFWAILGRGRGIHMFDDAHSRMMANYSETPMWWFFVVLLAALALGLGAIKGYPTETPVWGIFFSIGLGIIFLVPIGSMYAQTNQLFSLNVLTELVAGYAVPGHGIAMMIIKAFGLNTNYQAMFFMQDLKLGHYAKIPPRATFRCQLLATLWGSLVMIGVVNWQMSNIDNLCHKKKANGDPNAFWCPNESVYFSASVIWGVIGPKRIFGTQYPVLKWCFLIGCFLPIPFWFMDVFATPYFAQVRAKWESQEKEGRFTVGKFKRAFLGLGEKIADGSRYADPNLMLIGILNFFAPYNLTYLIPGLYVNFAFMKYIKKRYVAWFERYNYVMAAAFSAGMALSLIIIFFSLQYHPKDLDWWGNSVSFAGVDNDGPPLLTLAEGDYFGPAPGHYDVS